MFNVGTGELLVILLVALIVLGPEKLPETARKIGNVLAQLRRMSEGFQTEIRSAMDQVIEPTAVPNETPVPSTPAPAVPQTLPAPSQPLSIGDAPSAAPVMGGTPEPYPQTAPPPADGFDDDIVPVDPTGTGPGMSGNPAA